MKCQQLREAIVELARGAAVGPGTLAAVESHLEHCESCVALRAREQQLSAGLRALAATTDPDRAPEALERRMVGIFAARHPAQETARVPVVGTRWALRLRSGQARWVAAAAAVAVLWWFVERGDKGPDAPSAPPAVATATPGSEPVVTPPAAAPAMDASRAVRRPHRRQGTVPAVPRRTEFVALPGAVGLPDFESGEIIRMSIPVASLPTYGIEILPDAKGAPVQADLLVGQDGQARAIRLVTTTGSQ